MNIPQNHIAQIMEFGYSESEARFLYVVATHSGYFTVRQFLHFTGAHRGKRSTQFTRKTLINGHASVRDYMGYGCIYHLFSYSLYRSIEKDSLGNHRKHSFEFIRTRLVLLDFILSNRDLDYFETEQDKVAFFCDKLGIAKDFLPARVYEGGFNSRPATRYFVDRFPIFLATSSPGALPVVTFSFVDSGTSMISRFVTHLGAYQAFFRQLPSFGFLYISPTNVRFPKAKERFDGLVRRPLGSDMSTEVLRYFGVRQRFEKGQYLVPVTEDFEFLNQAKNRFHGERVERLYQGWVAGTAGEEEIRRELFEAGLHRKIFFDTFLVANHRSHLSEGERRRPSPVLNEEPIANAVSPAQK